ncbi:uncharacterized protein LOC126739699 isoform X2 [Anthonomus grandis grandis]|uniref:uncharacterized protein LOC126739699 isoform X2 n=1 Tax=Anthonomus grandis grandis TaxID=2921223 RepID=UPI002165DB3E|nr:uncharacterized protein LOC126739699 isoform X2 [Anthonomus grandis grandis]
MKFLSAPWALLLLLTVTSAEQNGWSWNQNEETPSQNSNEEIQNIAMSSFDLEPAATENFEQNTTDVEKVIDEILVSQRQGRALQGYDEIYSDPNVQEVLQKGDDGEARNVIKERLCYLGLMQCSKEIEGKRPYISPEELIYAQPVAINPVGRPIPTIPVKGVRGTYGPPKPLPVPHGNKFGPPPGKYPPSYSPNKPPRRNYGPSFSGNTLGGSKPGYFGGLNKPPFLSGGEILAEGEFLNKPPGLDYFNKEPSPSLTVPDAPYQFESISGATHKDKRVEITVNAQGGVATATAASAGKGGLVEHVHHHFHHNADGANKAPTVVVNPIPVAAAAVTTSLDTLSHSSSSFGSSSSLNSNGFIPIGTGNLPLGNVNQGYAGLGGSTYGGQTVASYGSGASGASFGGVKPVNENFGPQTFGASASGLGSFGASSSFGSNSFGSSGGYYGSNGLYKKELNVESVNNNYLGSNYADKYQGVESARAENYDCVCVPYDQCPTHDVIGRKDDLYLALDPRNLKSDIEAESDKEETRVITDGNGNMTVVRVPKDVTNSNVTVEAESKEAEKSRRKREAAAEEKQDNKEDGEHNIEGRQYQGQYQSTYDNIMKKLKPSIGISFGLPYQGGGGYPYSPNNVYPHHGTIGYTGINLGLVSVNPLVSVQFSKDDYGNKVIKPHINLHITPNDYLVNKFDDLVAYKKRIVSLNKHKHYHVHKGGYGYVSSPHEGYGGPYREHPGEFHHGPEYIHGPPGYHHTPEIYDGPPSHYHKPSSQYYDPSSEYHGPPGHYQGPAIEYDHPPSYDGPSGPFFPNKPSLGGYYDDPQNYGGGYQEPFYGRSYNNLTYTSGLNLLKQYIEKVNDGSINYGNDVRFDQLDSNSIEKDDLADNHTFRGGKSIKFDEGEASPEHRQESSGIRVGKSIRFDEGETNSRLTWSPDQYPTDGFRGGKSFKFEGESSSVTFPGSRRKRDITDNDLTHNESRSKTQKRQAYYGRPQTCGPRHVCCRRPVRPVPSVNRNTCGTRHSQGINGRIKNPVYVDGDSEFGEYPWQVAILKKDPKESVYVCGGTLIDPLHIITAAHCVKQYTNFDLRVRLGEWDVNHDVEFYPYIERDIASLTVHPEFYAGTLANDIAILRMSTPVDFAKHPHIAPACLPHPQDDYTGTRCWTTGWGKDAFGDFGKYQNILKEVDVPIVGFGQCQRQLQNTRLGYEFKLHPGFVCAGGEEGKDACKGDGGGPMVCERGGTWQVVGVVSWGIGCGQVGVPGVYVRVAHYLDWIRQVTQRY